MMSEVVRLAGVEFNREIEKEMPLPEGMISQMENKIYWHLCTLWVYAR